MFNQLYYKFITNVDIIDLIRLYFYCEGNYINDENRISELSRSSKRLITTCENKVNTCKQSVICKVCTVVFT